MAKNVSRTSLKISKNNEKKKQQLNSLIRVLKPKVYITDSSSFKFLVQELTGNGSISTPVSSPSPSSSISSPPPPVINHGVSEISSCCMEALSDTSLDSFEPCGSMSYGQMFREDIVTSVEYLLMNQQETDLFAYQDLDLESWLLDLDSYCNIVSAAHHIQQEVSIYDYELSGLI